jgi:hypothetical protein
MKQQQKTKGTGSAGVQVVIPGALATSVTTGNNAPNKTNLVAMKADVIGEPQLDEDLTDITAAAQLDKEDLLEEFLELLQ